jgi:hypothetical protein
MKPRKPFREELLVDAAGPGDGFDPRFDVRGARCTGKRKTLQLCREAERTFSAVLGGECNDDILRELIVASVLPAPNAGRLMVTVVLPDSALVSPADALERLLSVSGRLRAELAASVRRRKAPELAFRIVSDRSVM